MSPSPVLVATANLARAHRLEPERVPERERELAVAKITAYIEAQIAKWPPLTQEQRDQLAALLRAS